jgi:tetratricopeptide (TPR) repeat protein
MDALPSFEAPDLDEPAWDAPEPAPPPAAPGAPAPAPEAQGDDRIAQLLAEGQRAADEGRFQEAIDSWSRIFLIDVDHAEAARRIEQARRSKAEREREVEEVFHEGLAALEGGDRDTARQRFERVLEMQPSHLAARSYLSQLESGEPVDVRPPGPTGAETVALGELGSFDLADLATPRGREAPPGDLKEEILVPPPPGAEGAAREGAAASGALPSYGKAVAGREPGRRTFLLVGGLVLVLVLAAAAVLYVRKDSLFPNSDVEEPAAEAAPEAGAPGAIERAAELQERGQTAMALGLLRRIRPDDPRYDEAQELIARWETPPEPATEEAAGVPPEAMARRTRLLRAAEAAIQGERYLLAEQLYDRAAQIAELEGDHRDRLERARAEIAPLQPEIRLFREGEYELVLPRLWRLYEEDPSNRDVRAMLVDSYYNRGVRQLQRGDPAAAADEFEEALGIDPEDPDLQRHYLFAQTYQRRPRDLLYRIYVKYLPLR